MISYRNFVMKKLAINKYRDKYTIEGYFSYYLGSVGFREWLNASRDCEPSLGMVNSIAKTYIKHGKRKPEEIPMILVCLERQYGIKVPDVAGILSKEYWIEKARNYNWLNDSVAG